MRFFGNPIVGISGSIASILGIFVSVYLFVAGREYPELTYFVHPAKAAVVRTDQSSRLSVRLDEQPVTSDITAAQIAFWNAGHSPIREGNILKPLVIRTQDQKPILDVEVRKTSREVVKITLNRSKAHEGEVEIRWNILERNDGAVIQVIYGGDERVALEATSTLEGQPDIVRLDYPGTIRTPSEEYSRRSSWRGQLPGYLAIAMGVLVTLVWGVRLIRKRNRGDAVKRSDWVGIVQGPVFIVLAILMLWASRSPGPPFGF